METSVSPVSSFSLRESPSWPSKSCPSRLPTSGPSPGTRDLPKLATPVTSPAQLSSAKHLQRSIKTERRKDMARRKLMGTMYSKQNEVRRSFSFVAGERPQLETVFPSVSKSYASSKSIDTRNESRIDKKDTNHQSRTRPKSDKHKKEVANYARHSHGSKSAGHKLSLPEIIMEFNLEASMAVNDRSDFVSSRAETEDERALGVPYESFLAKPNHVLNNPCKGKYRPVTPGLLESLNQCKLPSKVKTEQWIKSMQVETRKSYCGASYNIGNLDNSNLAVPNWIYEYR